MASERAHTAAEPVAEPLQLPQPELSSAPQPEATYEHFTEVLTILQAQSASGLPDAEARPAAAFADGTTATSLIRTAEEQEEQHQTPLPPILLPVTERLGQLAPAEKEAVVPVMEAILHTLQAATIEGAPELAETSSAETRQQLETLCITLFDHLGIQYDRRDVTQFVGLLLQADATATKQRPQLRPDLERVGTREAKRRHAAALTDGFDDMRQRLLHALGIFVVLYTRRPNAEATR